MRLLLLLPRPVLLLSVTLIAGLCTFTLLIVCLHPHPSPPGPEGCRPGFCLLSSLRALSYTTEGGKGARATLALRGRGPQRAGGPLHQGVLAAVAELTLLPQASVEAVTQRASRKLARVQINSRRNEH